MTVSPRLDVRDTRLTRPPPPDVSYCRAGDGWRDAVADETVTVLIACRGCWGVARVRVARGG